MTSLGEMATYLPHRKGFAGYATRFWHPAGGFALGYNYLFKYLLICPNQINAAGIVLSWWTRSVPLAAWMGIIIACITGINFLGVEIFGEVEFWMSSLKVISLIGMILFGLLVDVGANPGHDVIGFRNWKPPNGPLGSYLLNVVGDEGLAKFLGFWAVMINALFAYMGTEMVGIIVGEAANPRKDIPTAIKRTFWRIAVFYIGGVFVIGLILPRTSVNNPTFFVAGMEGYFVAASPFVAVAELLAIRGLKHLMNAIVLIFVLSAANTDLYISSRTLYGLALEGKAPRIFRYVNRRGVPVAALCVSVAFSGLVFMNVAKGTGKVFEYLANLVSTFGALTWLCITYTHICFMKALEVQKVSRDTLPYRSPLQPYSAWFALIVTAVVTFFKGFDTFMPFKVDKFITAYIGLPVFVACFVFWRWLKGEGSIPSNRVDLLSGKDDIDREEEAYEIAMRVRGERSRWKRIWDAL